MKNFILILGLLIFFSLGVFAQDVILIGSVDWSSIVYNYNDFQEAVKSAETQKNILIKQKLDEDAPQSDIYEIEKKYEETDKNIKNRFKENINKAIEKLARIKGFALVLNESAVIYSAGQITDLTEDVLKLLNKKEEGK